MADKQLLFAFGGSNDKKSIVEIRHIRVSIVLLAMER